MYNLVNEVRIAAEFINNLKLQQYKTNVYRTKNCFFKQKKTTMQSSIHVSLCIYQFLTVTRVQTGPGSGSGPVQIF